MKHSEYNQLVENIAREIGDEFIANLTVCSSQCNDRELLAKAIAELPFLSAKITKSIIERTGLIHFDGE